MVITNKLFPTDEEVAKWMEETIQNDCSASSAIYLFRLWLNEREAAYSQNKNQPQQ